MDDIQSRMIELLPRLRRFCFALTGDMDKSDDLVQDVCERALAHIDQWQHGTRLDSWMYRIAQNLWLDRHRAQKVRGEQHGLDEVEDIAGCDGRDITENRLTLAAVNESIQRLAPEQRVLVAMVCIEGMSYKEASAVLEIPIGTVMSRLARARKVLFEAIADQNSHDAEPLAAHCISRKH